MESPFGTGPAPAPLPSFSSLATHHPSLATSSQLWTVNGKTFEGSAGDIFVIKAVEIHSFKAVSDSPLVQLDIHVGPGFIQENL